MRSKARSTAATGSTKSLSEGGTRDALSNLPIANRAGYARPFRPYRGDDGMKGIAILAAAAAMLSLAGCNRMGGNANATANAAGNSSESKPAGAGGNQTALQNADAGKLNEGGGAIPAT